MKDVKRQQAYGGVRRIKKPYRPPCLQRYGRVSSLTQGGGTSYGELLLAGARMTIFSDRSIKEQMLRIGTHPLGFGLYLFDYEPKYRDAFGHGRQFGVMADEVESVMPEAVLLHSNGLKMVDYAMLGIMRNGH